MRKLHLLALLMFWSASLLGCHPSQSEPHATYSATVQRHSSSSASRDLSQDEAAGGHTLKKHVGRTDDELRERLRHERSISAASTYSDRATAERAVGEAIERNNQKIQRWLEREGGHPNLVLDYDSDHPIGRTIRRGEEQAQPCSHAVVILRWDGERQYHVLTSYPEC